MVSREIIKIVSDFTKAINQDGIKIGYIYIYGSYASGLATKDSDIDVAVVSPDFGKDRYEEGKRLRQIAWRIDPRIEPIPISQRSFLEDDWIPLIYEIKTKGLLSCPSPYSNT